MTDRICLAFLAGFTATGAVLGALWALIRLVGEAEEPL